MVAVIGCSFNMKFFFVCLLKDNYLSVNRQLILETKYDQEKKRSFSEQKKNTIGNFSYFTNVATLMSLKCATFVSNNAVYTFLFFLIFLFFFFAKLGLTKCFSFWPVAEDQNQVEMLNCSLLWLKYTQKSNRKNDKELHKYTRVHFKFLTTFIIILKFNNLFNVFIIRSSQEILT